MEFLRIKAPCHNFRAVPVRLRAVFFRKARSVLTIRRLGFKFIQTGSFGLSSGQKRPAAGFPAFITAGRL